MAKGDWFTNGEMTAQIHFGRAGEVCLKQDTGDIFWIEEDVFKINWKACEAPEVPQRPLRVP